MPLLVALAPSRHRRVAQLFSGQTVGSHGPRRSGATPTRPRGTIAPAHEKSINMTAHDPRILPMSAAPGQDTPGATPIAFSLARKTVPCGLPIVRRHGVTRHSGGLGTADAGESLFFELSTTVTTRPWRG